jgi:pescadillo protein
LPFDIDYKVIGTFHEFYSQLLRFVNYKLYSELGMEYPPKNIQGISVSSDDNNIFIDPTQIKELQVKA